MGIFDFFATDIAIDLGTANTLIYIKGKPQIFLVHLKEEIEILFLERMQPQLDHN